MRILRALAPMLKPCVKVLKISPLFFRGEECSMKPRRALEQHSETKISKICVIDRLLSLPCVADENRIGKEEVQHPLETNEKA
jgi:hypothetical protein